MTDWLERAACKDIASEIFFPEGIDKQADEVKIATAKTICKQCPVAAECLLHAIEKEEIYGVWGSFAPKERKNIVSLFPAGYIDIELCKTIVNKEVRSIKAKILRDEFTF